METASGFGFIKADNSLLIWLCFRCYHPQFTRP